MSSDPGRDFPEYVSDESNQNPDHEEGTLFLPTPEDHRDPWMPFYGGILTGLAGSALVVISPWLGGALIAIGYGVTAFALRGCANRFAKALRLGFALVALLGAALIAADMAVSSALWHFVAMAGDRHLIFPGFALMPWVLGVLRYLYAVIWPPKRRTTVQPA